MVVARCESLAAAALAMGLTVPALSRRIRQLEAELGVALFRRLPRGLALTEAGAAYFAALAPAWENMRAATEAARDGARRDAITLSVIPSFAASWLVPRLPRFQARHRPAVALRTEAAVVDLAARRELDCAIRLGKGPWPGLVGEVLLPALAFPVAQPGQAAPRDAHALRRTPLIGTDHQLAFWGEWFAAQGIAEAPAAYRSFDNLLVAYEAAAAGMGIALGLDAVVRPFLESGRLVQLAPAVRLPRSFHLLRRREAPAPRGFGVFREWLLDEAREFAGAR